jgi:hypothetical protein
MCKTDSIRRGITTTRSVCLTDDSGLVCTVVFSSCPFDVVYDIY